MHPQGSISREPQLRPAAAGLHSSGDAQVLLGTPRHQGGTLVCPERAQESDRKSGHLGNR